MTEIDKAQAASMKELRESLILGNPIHEKFFSKGYKAGKADAQAEIAKPMYDREGNYLGEWNGKVVTGAKYQTCGELAAQSEIERLIRINGSVTDKLSETQGELLRLRIRQHTAQAPALTADAVPVGALLEKLSEIVSLSDPEEFMTNKERMSKMRKIWEIARSASYTLRKAQPAPAKMGEA